MAGQRFSKKNIIKDSDIDLYCQSIEKLLGNISERSAAKSRKPMLMDEPELMDNDEDMLNL